jgi:uncharacterized protein YbaR (Trm112 family)
MTIDAQLLDIIVCPACHGGLTLADQALACGDCGLVFPVRDGIPVLLVDEASRPEK